MSTPCHLFRRFAIAEAITWVLLILGMLLKYGTHTTDLGVRIFGMVHGVVFIAYCLVTLFVAVNQRWRVGLAVLGLACAIPPLATVAFDRWAERQGALDGHWRLGRGGDTPTNPAERLVAWCLARWCLARPIAAVGVGLVAVAALTALALFVGPPASKN